MNTRTQDMNMVANPKSDIGLSRRFVSLVAPAYQRVTASEPSVYICQPSNSAEEVENG
jgi:hypothetical protein